MTTADLMDRLLRIIDEAVIPAIALWLAYYVRRWVNGTLKVPPYEHKVTLQEPRLR